jgi:glutaredoxin 3
MLVEIYTKDNCGYCTAAKSLLEDNKISFREYKLNVDFTREMVKEKYPSATSYPVIVVDGYYIGGYNEVRPIVEEHKLTTQKYLAG